MALGASGICGMIRVGNCGSSGRAGAGGAMKAVWGGPYSSAGVSKAIGWDSLIAGGGPYSATGAG